MLVQVQRGVDQVVPLTRRLMNARQRLRRFFVDGVTMPYSCYPVRVVNPLPNPSKRDPGGPVLLVWIQKSG